MLTTRLCKKAFIVVFFINAFYTAQSQSFDLGLRGSLGLTYFYNPNFTKPGTYEGFRVNLSDYFGLQTALNFKHGYGLEVAIISGTLRQGYGASFGGSGSFPGAGIGYQPGESYSSTVALNVIQIPVLFRAQHKSGFYLEAGMGYEIISSAVYSATYVNPDLSLNYNVTGEYPSNDFLLIVGLGRNYRLKGTDFYINAGLQANYGLYDLQGVDGHGQALFGGPATTLYHPNYGKSYYVAYHPTHTIDFSLNVGLFYRFQTANIHTRQIEFK